MRFFENFEVKQFIIIGLTILLITLVLCYMNVKRKINFNLIEILDDAIKNDDISTSLLILRTNPNFVNVRLKDGFTPFLRACLFGNTQLVKYMLEFCGADVDLRTYNNESAFFLAAFDRINNIKSRDASLIHVLYYANVDINTATNDGFRPIQLAAIFGHSSLVKWLLSKNVDVNVHPCPYFLARSQGHLSTAMIFKNMYLKSIE